jgi:hypothetical protein
VTTVLNDATSRIGSSVTVIKEDVRPAKKIVIHPQNTRDPCLSSTVEAEFVFSVALMPIRTARKASQIVPRTSSAATRNLQACTPSLSAIQIHLMSQVDADRATLVETLVVQHCIFLCPASASHGLGRADTQICLSRGQCCCPDDRPEICVPECRGKWTRRKLWRWNRSRCHALIR